MMKSPSKFLSLKFLHDARQNYYKSEGGIEYCPSEVDCLIAWKEEKELLDDSQEWNEYDFISDFDDDGIAYPIDADLTDTEEEVFIPTSILEEIANVVTKVIKKIKKVFGMARRRTTEVKIEWVRPDWQELIPEAKSNFKCSRCDQSRPWQEQWQSTEELVCSICDGCKKVEDGYKNSTRRNGREVNYNLKPGVRPGPRGAKVKITVALDQDLNKIAQDSGNRSDYINRAVRYFFHENT